MMTTEISKRETEEIQARQAGHELGCFEWIAEEIVEDTEADINGDFDETWDGMTMIDRILLRLAAGTAECRCERDEE